MTPNTDFDLLARTWLQDGPTTMPDRSLQAALDEVHLTSQRRFGAAWRTLRMNSKTWRIAVAAAFAVLIVAAGAYFLGRTPGGTGVTGPSPSPSPTPQVFPSDGFAEPGTYSFSFTGLPSITFTVPAGWRNGGAGGPTKNDGSTSALGLSPWIVGNLPVDPCLWADGMLQPPVGPSVDDLANALARMPRRNGTAPSAVTLGGLQGKYLELSIPADLDFATCSQVPGTGSVSPHFFVTWVGPAGDDYNGFASPGSKNRVWILDDAGVRFVLDATTFPDASAADRAELQAIIDSIRIGPVTPASPATSSP
jgi:hypothetical protein